MRSALSHSCLLNPVTIGHEDPRSSVRSGDPLGFSGLRKPLAVDPGDLTLSWFRRTFGFTEGPRRQWDKTLKDTLTFHDELIRADRRAFETLSSVKKSIETLLRFGSAGDANLDHLWETTETVWDTLQKTIDKLEERIRALPRSTQRPEMLVTCEDLPDIQREGGFVTTSLDQMVGNLRDLQSRLDCVVTDAYRLQWLRDNTTSPAQIPETIVAAYGEVCSSLCGVPFHSSGPAEQSNAFAPCQAHARFYEALHRFIALFLEVGRPLNKGAFFPNPLTWSQAPDEALGYLKNRVEPADPNSVWLVNS